MVLTLHPNYVKPRRRLATVLDGLMPGRMVFLVGPSGVGKTTLRHSVMREVYGHPKHWPKGRIPVIESTAMLPTESYFSSNALVRRLHEQLQSPRLRWFEENGLSTLPHSILDDLVEADEWWKTRHGKRMTESETWNVVERMLKSRSCSVISLDQANAFLKNRTNKTPTDHTLHLMSFAEEAGISFIMTGIPEVVQMWGIHSELRRRVEVVWVPPYSEKHPEDRQAFATLIRSLASRYPKCDTKTLVRKDAEVLAATGGIIGVLAQLLKRASVLAAEEGGEGIRWSHVERSFYSQMDLESMWNDIHHFEQVMAAGSVTSRASQIKQVWE